MGSAADVWLCVLLGLLFAILSYLRSRFPAASRSRQTAAVVTAATLFLSACSVLGFGAR
jgi:hypothetical protein